MRVTGVPSPHALLASCHHSVHTHRDVHTHPNTRVQVYTHAFSPYTMWLRSAFLVVHPRFPVCERGACRRKGRGGLFSTQMLHACVL